MNNPEYISEDEATRITGVSAKTLLRFSEAGYLAVSTDGTNNRYLRRQLEDIFGAASVNMLDQASPMNNSGLNGNGTVAETLSDATILAEANVHEPYSTGPAHTDDAPPHAPLSDDDNPAVHTLRKSQATADAELQRLQNLLSMQERILDAKDDEIADLRNQRSWLRERIEKLEEKADRDQLLLLSETQTIRKLIAIQETRKSTVRQFLEWVGLAPHSGTPSIAASSEMGNPPSGSSGGRTIEVRAANSD